MSSHRPYYEVYSLNELSITGVKCHVVRTYEGLDIIEFNGMKTTSVNQTIIDMLRYDRDDGVICECIADWYYGHDETFEGLIIPDDIREAFEDIKQDAIDFYNDGY